MPPTIHADHGKVILNSPSSPPVSQKSGSTPQTGKMQDIVRGPKFDTVEITVLRADNLPRLKNLLGKKRQFFVSATNEATTEKTTAVQSVAQAVAWGEKLGPFVLQPSSSITLRLYTKRFGHKDDLVGTCEVPCESQTNVAFTLNNGYTDAVRPAQQVIVYITVTVSTHLGAGDTKLAVSDSGGSLTPEIIGPQATPTTTAISAFFPPETIPDVVENQAVTLLPESAIHRAEKAVDTMKVYEGAVETIQLVMNIVDSVAEVNSYAKVAWGLLSSIPKAFLKQTERDDNVQTLLLAIHDAFDFAQLEDVLKSIKAGSKQAEIVADMLKEVQACGEFIQRYANDPQLWKRTLKNIGGQADPQIQQHRDTLARLKETFKDHAIITIQHDVGELRDAGLDAKISEISYRPGWRFGKERRCLQGTRIAFLDYISNWVRSPQSECVLVLFGQAGMGKSTIAHEVARRFHEEKLLGSSFVFKRGEDSKRNAFQLFKTIARDLCDRYPSFKIALANEIKKDSSLPQARDFQTLFEYLLLQPLKSLRTNNHILIVIDALDESGDTTGRAGLHKFLAEHLCELPSNFRVLITSRPENGIEPAFDNATSVHIKRMEDHDLAANTEEDIRAYVRANLASGLFQKYGFRLAEKAEGLFQWAVVACEYITDPPAGYTQKDCIDAVLKHPRNLGPGAHGALNWLYQLYMEVLGGYFKEDYVKDRFRSVMGQLLAAFEPLSIDSLTTLRQHLCDPDYDDSVLAIVKCLGSLMSNVTSSDKTLPIVPLHTSFRDFLTDEASSGSFYINLANAHGEVAYSCLDLMVEKLKFNMCHLESSYLANSQVPDLESRIDRYIPLALNYACRFWDGHLELITFEHGVFIKLRCVFEEKFLYWLEVLSLIGNLGLATSALSSLTGWLGKAQSTDLTQDVKTLRELADDAATFVRYFGMAMAQSTPHIYLSALPFAPTLSKVYKRSARSFPRTLSFDRGQLADWPALRMVIRGHGSSVESVAFSPDGQHIVSGLWDCTIRVWNATTGETVAGPFTGHTKSVLSVAFSPDGQHIVSGSEDRTVRVWNATAGELVAGPFTGHTESVRSVAFSPDGQHIASGSHDHTIRVWNATTGETVAGPFTGHTESVWSVAFSPDGQHIVSGLGDCTIRMWNAMTGETVVSPFTGHTKPVRSVAFSPDGQHIVSGSEDCTIRVWNATTGETVAGPFTGHTRWVGSVAFSPNGHHIVSGSWDCTIRVWSATTGETVAGSFTGHTLPVLSVALSPDGQHIASGSHDDTICVWKATTGETVVVPFTGHTELVSSVAFSPDGRRVASGSYDYTIRVWNATTGESVAGPFTGHTEPVWSVAFSPDGQYIVSGSRDYTIRVWNATTGKTVAGPFTGHTDSVSSVAFSPDGQHIVSGSWDCTIRVWNPITGETVAGPFTGHTESVWSVAFSPDGQHIVSGSRDYTIRVWNATTGETVAGPSTGHTELVRSVAFSPDGQHIVSGSGDYTICVWNATTGELVTGPFTGHTESVSSVAFLPDGQHIVSGSHDSTIRVRSATTGETVAGPFTGHTSWVSSVALSPDGQHIVSGSHDHTIRLWNVTTGEAAAGPFTGHTSSVPSLTPPRDGQHAPSGSHDCMIHVVKNNLNGTERTVLSNAMDQSKLESEGWITGDEGALVIWIPQIHRSSLHRPANIWVAGPHETRLDLSRFVHGRNWVTCIDE